MPGHNGARVKYGSSAARTRAQKAKEAAARSGDATAPTPGMKSTIKEDNGSTNASGEAQQRPRKKNLNQRQRKRIAKRKQAAAAAAAAAAVATAPAVEENAASPTTDKPDAVTNKDGDNAAAVDSLLDSFQGQSS